MDDTPPKATVQIPRWKRSLTIGYSVVLVLLAAAAQAQNASPALLEQGRRVATAADCAACHTTGTRGKPYAGGYGIVSPLGSIFATNITPSRTAGIGNYSEEQFARAVREGIRADGARLYPAMPYTAYAGMTDEDLHALYAYFMQGVAPVDTPAPRTELPFPFRIRISMAIWNLLFLSTNRFTTDPARSAEWNRGKYLADVLAHCGTCHTPRNFLMAERRDQAYGGASLGRWYAPNITSDRVSGIGGWSDEELIQYLQTGRAHGKSQAGGGMGEAVSMSLQHLPIEDLQAIVVYLRSMPAIRDPRETIPAFAHGQRAGFEPGLRGLAPSNSTSHPQSGEALYSAYCASCHQTSGEGTPDQGYPRLMNNTATGRPYADNLVSAILYGVERDVGGNHILMPRFDELSFVQFLSDAQVASISTYVMRQFGNASVAVSAADVAQIRQGGPPSPLLTASRYAVPAGIAATLIILALMLFLLRSRLFSGFRADAR